MTDDESTERDRMANVVSAALDADSYSPEVTIADALLAAGFGDVRALTALDGSTEPGPDDSYPRDAGQFAARWNGWTPERRDEWVTKLTRLDQERLSCVEQDHQGNVEWLETERRRDQVDLAVLAAERDTLRAQVAAVRSLLEEDREWFSSEVLRQAVVAIIAGKQEPK